jgi:hypothetical protein
MGHVVFPILIKSSTDGMRLREEIREEREHSRRYHAKLMADVAATLREADEVLARTPRVGWQRGG